jgi:glyoxylase-like metal-dependent hydrolase (beta-lactamase superfamily II)
MKTQITLAFILSTVLLNFAHAGNAPAIQVIEINDHILAFYDGRDPGGKRVFSKEWNWVDDAAMKLGVCTYAIHKGNQAIVYDTFPSTAQARWVRDYLQKKGIKHFTVVISHWHLDHIGGNLVYSDSNIIATNLAQETLAKDKEQIETGTGLFGPPEIRPLVLPNIAFRNRLDLYVADLKLELHQINIHSADMSVLYIPAEKILLAGDTLEDSVTYMVEVENLAEHVRNLKKLRSMDIERIYPNHGDPDVIKNGGYSKTFIDATIDYISKMLARAHDKDYLKGTMKEYIADPVAKGWIHKFAPYREVHEQNLKLVHEYYKDKPLPDLKGK